MALRGTQAKADVQAKILELFEGSFVYGKEIRIPTFDATSGEMVQIKVTLTAAKESVNMGADVALPTNSRVLKMEEEAPKAATMNFSEPSEEEMNRMRELVATYRL